jgi:dTDP-glucose 4,6-dehydratase
LKIAVLGSNSFSGSHFVDHALSSGHSVLGISRSPEVQKEFRPYAENHRVTDFTFFQASLRFDLEKVSKRLFHYKPDYVVNFAAQSMVGQSWDNPEDWYQTNVVALSSLANTLRQIESLIKYVHVTTPEVYGSTPDWISEGADFNPSTPYAVSRAAGDMHMRIMQKHTGLPVVFTRAANVFGPGQQLYRVIPRAFMSALLGRQFELHGGGHSRRSFIHVSDVSRATLTLAEHGVVGHDYHISTRELVTIRDVVERAYALAGVSFQADAAQAEDRLGKDAGYFLDSTKLRDATGWNTLISLDEGLKQTFDWIVSNLDSFSNMSWDYLHKS